jgi:hypothetical protein
MPAACFNGLYGLFDLIQLQHDQARAAATALTNSFALAVTPA